MEACFSYQHQTLFPVVTVKSDLLPKQILEQGQEMLCVPECVITSCLVAWSYVFSLISLLLFAPFSDQLSV